jgi:hypothetical protein
MIEKFRTAGVLVLSLVACIAACELGKEERRRV